MVAGPEDNTILRVRQSCGDWRQSLRAEMLARRQAMSAGEWRLRSACIVSHLMRELSPVAGSVVGFCWPIRNEPDVRHAVEIWCASGVRAALPVVEAPGMPLRFRAWTRDTPLIADIHGIPTSGDGEWLTPDLLLLPLNAFDAAGYRLGYGGGYFDRTLVSLSTRPCVVGIGFEINRVESIRPEIHDQPVDWIVTEQGAFRVDRQG